MPVEQSLIDRRASFREAHQQSSAINLPDQQFKTLI
jgi:hypothetical protein